MTDDIQMVSMYTHWHLPKQRPHHLVDFLNKQHMRVNIFTGKSFRSKEWVPVHSPNQLHVHRMLPGRLQNVKAVAAINRYQTEKMVQAFINCEAADLHIYAAVPRVLPQSKPPILIYDCMDDWSGFSRVDPLLEQERSLCRMADRIWVTSKVLHERMAPQFSDKTEYVPNGVDYDHFAQTLTLAEASENKRKALGYVGALEWWFDADLVSEVAERLPNWDILLIGFNNLDAAQRKVLNRPNIRFFECQPYEALPGFFAGFDVAMIPFKLTELIQAVNPIKLYEYFAAGLPVVATRMPEIQSFIEPGVLACCDNGESFAKAVRAIGETKAADRRLEIAAANTWGLRFSRALANTPGIP